MTSRPKILLVSRDPHVTVLRRQILEREGYSVTVTDNVNDDCLLHLESVCFDGVIVGYSIPPQERTELTARIRERHPKTPILAIFKFPGELDRTATKFIYSLDGPEVMLQALKEMLTDTFQNQHDHSQKNPATNNSIN